MGTNITKRKLLTSIFPAFAATTLPAILTFPTSAKADGGATAMVVIAVVQLAMSMGRKSDNGLGKILGAMDMKLNRLLQGQIDILKAVGHVSTQIDNLKTAIPDMLIEPEFQATYKKSFDAAQKAESLLKALAPVKPFRYGKEEFDSYQRVVELTDTAVNDFIVDSQRQVKGLPGINCLLKANATAILLGELVHVLKGIDKNMPPRLKPESWNANDRFTQISEKLSSTINQNLINGLSTRLMQEQDSITKDLLEKMKKDPLARFMLSQFPRIDEGYQTVSKNLHFHSINETYKGVFKSFDIHTHAPLRNVRTIVGHVSTGHGGGNSLSIILPILKNLQLHDTLQLELSLQFDRVEDTNAYIMSKRDLKIGAQGWYVTPGTRVSAGDYRAGLSNVTERQFAGSSGVRGIGKPMIDAHLAEADALLASYNQTICYIEAIKESRIAFRMQLEKIAGLNQDKAMLAAPACLKI